MIYKKDFYGLTVSCYEVTDFAELGILRATYGNTVDGHLKIVRLNKEQLLDYLTNADVLNYFINQWHSEIEQNRLLHPIEVMKTLEQLGHHTHYLATKPIAYWDEYDHSNYRALLGKSGKVYTVYGIYDADITHDDVEQLDSPPKRFYETYDKAKSVMNDLISSGKFKENEIQVLPLLVGDA